MVNVIRKLVRVLIPALWEGEDEPDVYGYEPVDSPRSRLQGTEAEVQRSILRIKDKLEGASEVIEGGDTVAGIPGRSKYRRSWKD